MRARTNISLKDRYTATLTDFKGVDLNTSPLRVAPNRASSMKNFICDNGILHKRPGWEEQIRITDDNGNALEIHAIFPFSEDGTEILLIHAGTGIYHAQKTDGKWSFSRLDDGYMDINENRASCFYRGGKAYIAGCGNFLCYGKHDGENYTLEDVANSDLPYVPTTSIGIGGSEEQSSLEPVNLLTRKRINKLTGDNNTDTLDRFRSHCTLDAKAAEDTYVLVEAEIYYQQSFEDIDTGKIMDGEFILSFSEKILSGLRMLCCVSPSLLKGKYHSELLNYLISKGKINLLETDSGEKYFTMELLNWQTLAFDFPAGSRDGGPNITVTFTAEGEKEHAERIKQCRFGTTFGVNGANDRLFLAGNPDHPNMDFWSEANDFTYFPDGNTMEVGSAHAAINGYARLSDTTLAVLKEEKAGEPTIFYRTGAEKHDTVNLKYDAYFPVAAGIAGDGIVNHHAGATLAGDVMVVTRSGVHALVLSSNVASGERYTRERSRPIYRELANSSELADAAGIVYRNRYYLALPNAGKCYVADAHYKVAFDGSTDYNYEWWVWDNVHATCFAEYKDKLLFGTPDGQICAFVEGTFADRTFTELGEGDLLCDDECGEMTYNENVKPAVGDRVVLYGGVYAVEDEECLDGEELYVSAVNEEHGTFTVARGRSYLNDKEVWNNLRLTQQGNANLMGRYVHVSPVRAEWVTPIMDFGSNASAKTLLGFTVATEPGIGGLVTFGYETRRMEGAMTIPVGGEGFDFSGLDFNNFSFDASFACSFTRRMNLRNFNFIVFRFGSDVDQDCAVSGVTLQYKINRKNLGLR